MRLRESTVREMIEAEGLAVVSIEIAKHYKARVRREDGVESTQVFSYSPSDRRSMLNRRAELRRFARGS